MKTMSVMTQSSLEDATHRVLVDVAMMYGDKSAFSGMDVLSLLDDLACYARCERSALPPELLELHDNARHRPAMVIDKQQLISKLLHVVS